MELEVAVIREMQRWTTFHLKEELVTKQVLIVYLHSFHGIDFSDHVPRPKNCIGLHVAKELITRLPLNWLNRYKTCAGYLDAAILLLLTELYVILFR